MNLPAISIALLSFLLMADAAQANMSIVNSKHNLSASGPGEIRALLEERICIFCHTPHNATPFTPLWNKGLQPQNYILYESSTLSAAPQQPSGATRLCLSCHDGTIALGDVLRPVGGIMMTMELTTGRKSFIGTNISDDHPVSFNYNEALPNPEMAPTIPQDLRTYGSGIIHCTTCHDPHDDTYGKFLVMDNSYSALCMTCHTNKAGWADSIHRSSSKIWHAGGMSLPRSVAEYGCGSCHTSHGANGPKRLLHQLEEEQVCYPCHNGSVATKNIESQFSKFSRHPVEATTIDLTGNSHDPDEDISFLQGHVECVDCHNPHAAKETSADAIRATGSQALVAGIDNSGGVADPITYGYELCFKCHGDSSNSIPVVTRWSNENNTRLEFDPINPSFHPVVAIGKNADMPSLPSIYEPLLSPSSRIGCIDCHDSNETSAIGGLGPKGPHGSIFKPILRQRYDTMDFLPESQAAYALCYRCHDRTKLLNDQGLYGIAGHKSHIVDQRAPCSVCHDPHGVKYDGNGDHTHLINFDMAVVSPYGSNATPLFNDKGTRSGSCVLVCHGATHDGITRGAY